MTTAIGVVVTEHIVAGRLEDMRLAGETVRYPQNIDEVDALNGLPVGDFVDILAGEIISVAKGDIDAIGVAVPGIVRQGVVEDSPNLAQIKGMHLAEELTRVLTARGITAPVHIANDADAIAAGVAATRGQLNKLTRVWTIGNGIGYGRWPYVEGVWEGGHITVTLDPKERFCGCGGVGHLEGIMGTRAMRKRFLDMEPDEIFANAKAGDERCAKFARLWHRALAAGAATSVHISGPGRFFITGPHARHVDIELLSRYVYEMVKMSPLQGSVFEVTPADDRIAIIGAAVNALNLRGGRE